MSATTVKVEVVERGFAGHFVLSHYCRYQRTTDVGATWRVSTIGDYYQPPLEGEPAKRTEVGYRRFYETMVFRLSADLCDCGCGAPQVVDWSEKDFAGYQTAGEADAGHVAMVTKYIGEIRRPPE